MKDWLADNSALLEMFHRGLSARQMGERLGRSRGSILGRLFRLGYSNSRVQPSHREMLQPVLAPVGSLLPVERDVPQDADREARAAVIPGGPCLPTFPPKIEAFIAMGAGRCKWPIGDPKDDAFHYCLEPCSVLKPYCRAHERKAHKQ